jgi:Flp pilus assembly protein TadG
MARQRMRLQRGQTLIIFALSLTVLIGLAGMVIDVGRAFDLYARMQRAAEAGALAGVLYMPQYYSSARTPGDGLSAVARATAEVVKDGFGTALSPGVSDCPTPPTSVEVAVCPVAGAQSDLEVIITEQLSVVLLSGLGVQPITLTATGQAEYLPPVQIGSRANYFGDQVECSPGNGSTNSNTSACSPYDTSHNHLQYFMASMNGPAELKESGDPMVYCAEGPAEIGGPNPYGNNGNPYPLQTYNGYLTNHQAWPDVQTGSNALGGISKYCGEPQPGGNPGNVDYQPDGYAGPMTAGTAHPGGYNYYVGIMPGVPPSTLWLYNPFYIPQDATDPLCQNFSLPLPLDRFIDNTPCGPYSTNFYQGPQGEGIGNRFDGVHHDAPLFYFAVTYTLYSVTNLYDRSSDVQMASETFNPYDDTLADLQYHGCSSGQVYNPYWNGANTPNVYHNPSQVMPGQGCVSAPISPSCAGDSQWCALENCPLGANSLQNNPQNDASRCPAGTPFVLQPGAYRLVVEATGLPAVAPNGKGGYDYRSGLTDGWGGHTYGVKVCAAVNITNPVNCYDGNNANGAGGNNNPMVSVYGWNNEDVTVQQPLATAAANPNYPQTSCVNQNNVPYACVDLACIPTSYAGRTVSVQLFDPGDGYGDIYVGVSPPPGAGSTVTIKYSHNYTTTTVDGVAMVHALSSNGYRPFNGLWLDVTVTLGPSYQGDCFSTGGKSGRSGWFQIVYASSNGQPTDRLAVQMSLVGSPVHLLVPALV